MTRRRNAPRGRLFGTLALAAVAVVLGLALVGRAASPAGDRPVYRSPQALAYAPDGRTLAVSDRTAGELVLMDAASLKVARRVALEGEPEGVAWHPDGSRVCVAECGAGTVAEVDPKAGKVTRRFAVGPRPVGLAIDATRGLLVVANRGTDTVSLVALDTGKEAARVAALPAPVSVAVSPERGLAIVGHLIPATPASDPKTSAAVSLIALETRQRVSDIRLPPNGALVRGIAVSPDGRWAYAVHTLGRTTLPTTQLERGWVNTNALTILDLESRTRYATLLLDQLSQGAADPWGVAVVPDASTLWVSLSGCHQLARIDLAPLHEMLEGTLPEGAFEKTDRGYPRTLGLSTTWKAVKADPAKNRDQLTHDLAALYGAGLIDRRDVGGQGPRGIAVSPDGSRVAAALYFAGTVATVEGGTHNRVQTAPVGDQPEADAVRHGEKAFHDATLCFQQWLSCATCHPDGRVDGLNWDLLNDGIGNPKNTRTMVLSAKTPPVMSLGVRSRMEVAAEAGYRFILFREPDPADLEATQAYLRALPPDGSPYRAPDGSLTAEARRGKALFESKETGCAECHPAPLYTDLRSYDVGTRGELDRADAFDTPTLVELWRTGPYLHDGAAVTVEDVLTSHNKGDRHGKTSQLSKEEVAALAAFLRSL